MSRRIHAFISSPLLTHPPPYLSSRIPLGHISLLLQKFDLPWLSTSLPCIGSVTSPETNFDIYADVEKLVKAIASGL